MIATQRQATTADAPSTNGLRRGNETELTHALKWAAWRWLYEVASCRVIGFEVRLEGPFGRIADVVGLGPENRVFLVEVKSSRSDMQRDDHTPRDADKLAARGRPVAEAADLASEILESAKKIAKGRLGDSWRDSLAFQQALADHQRAVNRRRTHRGRLETFSTKFHDPAYLRTADYHYLMAPTGMLRPSEVPDQWGLLNMDREVVVDAPLKQVKRVTAHVLRAIARAGTRDLMTACGVEVSRDIGRSTMSGAVDQSNRGGKSGSR